MRVWNRVNWYPARLMLSTGPTLAILATVGSPEAEGVRQRLPALADLVAGVDVEEPDRLEVLPRAFAQGGYASLENVHSWMLGFVSDSPQGEKYGKLAAL